MIGEFGARCVVEDDCSFTTPDNYQCALGNKKLLVGLDLTFGCLYPSVVLIKYTESLNLEGYTS